MCLRTLIFEKRLDNSKDIDGKVLINEDILAFLHTSAGKCVS